VSLALPEHGRAPDYCEPVVGWRVWHAVAAGHELVSVFRHAVWPHEGALQAICTWRVFGVRARHSRDGHPAPWPDCQCGIYAAQPKAFSDYLDDYIACIGGHISKKRLLVFGRVSLWGTVVEHDLGWRASHAYPERLFVVPGRADPETVTSAIRGLGRYGVPVGTFETPSLAVSQVERQLRRRGVGSGDAGA
jgi:hypothetical protein